eukprot:PhF_6_TR15112/c0_g1_i2/m.23802
MSSCISVISGVRRHHHNHRIVLFTHCMMYRYPHHREPHPPQTTWSTSFKAHASPHFFSSMDFVLQTRNCTRRNQKPGYNSEAIPMKILQRNQKSDVEHMDRLPAHVRSYLKHLTALRKLCRKSHLLLV